MCENQAVESFEVNGLTVNIYYDEEPVNPRTAFDNFGKMVCFHPRYDLGDKHDYENTENLIRDIQLEEGSHIIYLPLYLYDHSGLTISTGQFADPWDSGCVGLIYVSKKDVRKEYECRRISRKTLDRVLHQLESEVKEYDSYLTNEVYYYTVEDPDGEVLESCGGFFDLDYCKQEATAVAAAEYASTQTAK